jgi:hypothetical protein
VGVVEDSRQMSKLAKLAKTSKETRDEDSQGSKKTPKEFLGHFVLQT